MATMNTALWTTERQTEMYRFFSVAFNAAPGTTYMDQLYDAVISGMSTKEIVNVFVTKSEFTSVYPRSMPNATFATKIVDAVVGSSATAAAKAQAAADITAALTAGWSRGDIVYQIFTNLATKPATDADWAGTAKQMANQVEVARYYTETLNKGGTDLTTLQKVVAGVTATTDTTSVAALAAVIDTALPPASQAFTLTTGTDSFTGGAGADSFVAGFTTAAGWSAGDALDGGAGSDTLLIAQGAAVANPAGTSVKNIESATVSSGAAVNLDTSNWSGLINLSTTGSNAAGSSAVTAATTTNITASTSAASNPVTVNGGKDVAVTVTGMDGTGSIAVGGSVAPVGAITVSSTGTVSGQNASPTLGGSTVVGGTSVAVTELAGITNAIVNAAKTATNNGTVTLGAVSVTGSLLTTSVTVTQEAQGVVNTGGGVANRMGITPGAVTVNDVNASSKTAAGSIANVTLSNYGNNSSIDSSALTTVTLSGTASTSSVTSPTASAALAISRGDLTAVPAVNALTINLQGGHLGGITDAEAAGDDGFTTIAINASKAASTLANLTAVDAKTLTVSGDQNVTFTDAALLNNVTAVTVTNSGATTFGASTALLTAQTLNNSATFTGGDGAESIILNQPTKAIVMGGGNDTVTLRSGSFTGTVDGGEGTADTLRMTGAVAEGASSALTSKLSNFERIAVIDDATPAARVINLASFGAINHITTTHTTSLTLNNAAANATVVQGSSSTATTVNYADSTGSSDALTLSLTSAGTARTITTLDISGVESLAVTNTDSSTTLTNVVNVISTLTDTSLKSITATGNAGLTISTFSSGTGTALTSIDGSGLNNGYAALTIATIPAIAAAATITGGAGNDSLGSTSNGATAALRMDGGAGSDVIRGGAGADTIIDTSATVTDPLTGAVTAAGNQLIGGSGADTITGGAANDTIDGGSGNDSIIAAAGADNITSGTGSDFVDAGDGNDTISSADGNDTVVAGAGDDQVSILGNGAGSVDGGDGADTITGGDYDGLTTGTGNDVISGGSGADSIIAGTGNDNVSGGDGNDIFVFANAGLTSADTVAGGDGTDTLEISATGTAIANAAFTNVSSVERITSQSGVAIKVTLGDKALGITTVIGSSADDVLVFDATYTTATATIDLTTNAAGADSVDASASSTALAITTTMAGLSSGTDTLKGGTGASDSLSVTASTATSGSLAGVSGIETINLISGGSNNVTLTGLAPATGKTVTVIASSFTNPSAAVSFTAGTASGVINITAGAGNDTIDLSNSSGNNIASGGLGSDTMLAGTGLDNLSGGDGNDTVRVTSAGFSAADTFAGGAGTDILELTTASDSNPISDAHFTNVSSFATLRNVTASHKLSVTLDSLALATGIGTVGHSGDSTVNTEVGGNSTANDTVTVTTGFTGSLTVNLGSGVDKFDAQSSAATASAGTFTINMSALPDNQDYVRGGTGSSDTLVINGDSGTVYLGNTSTQVDTNNSMSIAVGAATVSGIETIRLVDRVQGTNSSWVLTTVDANVASGKTLAVTLGSLTTTVPASSPNPGVTHNTDSVTLAFNGQAESNGAFIITGGAFNDTIIGGAGADTIYGGEGRDSITGGLGADVIYLGSLADGTPDGVADTVVYLGTGFETGTLSPTAFYYGGVVAAGTVVNTAGLDKVYNFNAGSSSGSSTGGDTILTPFGGSATNGTNGVGKAWTDLNGYLRGTYDATAQTFVLSATGLDTMYAFDADGNTATSDLRAVILVGYVDTLGNDSMSSGLIGVGG